MSCKRKGQVTSELIAKKKLKTCVELFGNSKGEDYIRAEYLDLMTIMEGMVLLGCVTQVTNRNLLMSLPGYSTGIVPATNISDKFTELMRTHEYDGILNLSPAIELGMTLPCRVMRVTYSRSSRHTTLIVSINPKDVNSNLTPHALYKNMVLPVAIRSREDHGYVVDTGINNTSGFLPAHFTNSDLCVGNVVLGCITKFKLLQSLNIVHFRMLSFDEPVPQISSKGIELVSILPGAIICAYVIKIDFPFAYLRYNDFKACINMLHYKSCEKISVATKLKGMVLYVHPVTRMIYLSLSRPTPSRFSSYFGCQKYDILENIKFKRFHRLKAYFTVKEKAIAVTNKQKFLKDCKISEESLKSHVVLPKARVLNLFYMDNLLNITFEQSFVNKDMNDIKICGIYEAVVRNHVAGGMVVSLFQGLSGLIQRVHLSDVLVSKPKVMFPVGTKVKCRVVSLNPLLLTCKESFLSLHKSEILQSYDEVQKGGYYKGVIVKITKNYSVILFFNNVKGIAHSEYIPSTCVFFVGQTVQCEVLKCLPSQKRLFLSLMATQSSSSSSIDAE